MLRHENTIHNLPS